MELTKSLPEFGGFGFERINHHQEVQLRECVVQFLLVGKGGNRIEALANQPLHLAVDHALERVHHVV